MSSFIETLNLLAVNARACPEVLRTENMFVKPQNYCGEWSNIDARAHLCTDRSGHVLCDHCVGVHIFVRMCACVVESCKC